MNESNKFISPDFTERTLELRYENEIVCIYGTKEGLKRLSNLVLELIENPKRGHIHLEDYEILTKKSLTGVIAVF